MFSSLCEFPVFHLNAIGQEDNAPNYPLIAYPTLDELADQIVEVCDRYKIKSFIGFGVGAGANILSRFALKHPKHLEGLVLINPTASQASWTEWLYQKLNVYYLGSSLTNGLNGAIPECARNYLMWHHFGNQDETRNFDLIELYRNHFMGKSINAYNLSLFIDSFIRRTDLRIDRSNLEKNFKCSVLLVVGALSPHIDDSVNMNGRLNPVTSTWLKLQGCGMVLEEQPEKVVEALKLFIQGLGYSLAAYDRQRSLLKNNSLDQPPSYSSLLSRKLIDECEIITENTHGRLGDKIRSDGDKCQHIEKVEYMPASQDGRIIENPIQHC